MKEFTGRSKTNVGASEINPGGIGRSIEIRRVVKTHIGKIGAIAHVLIPGGVGIGQELAWLRKFDSGIAS